MLYSGIYNYLKSNKNIQKYVSVLSEDISIDQKGENIIQRHFVAPFLLASYLEKDKVEIENLLLDRFGSIYDANIASLNSLLKGLHIPKIPEECNISTKLFEYKSPSCTSGGFLTISELVGEKSTDYKLEKVPAFVKDMLREAKKSERQKVYYQHQIIPLPSIELLDAIYNKQEEYDGIIEDSRFSKGLIWMK